MTNDNRRAYPRFHISQMIELEIARENFLNASGINISLGGLLCESDSAVDPLITVFLMVGLPQKDGSTYDLKTEGVVMRCDALDSGGYQLGIHFTETSSIDLEKIEEYIVNSWDAAEDKSPN